MREASTSTGDWAETCLPVPRPANKARGFSSTLPANSVCVSGVGFLFQWRQRYSQGNARLVLGRVPQHRRSLPTALRLMRGGFFTFTSDHETGAWSVSAASRLTVALRASLASILTLRAPAGEKFLGLHAWVYQRGPSPKSMYFPYFVWA